jgi:hypothetical protein
MRRFARALFLIAALAPQMAAAADDPTVEKAPEPPRNKLTVSYYDFSSGKNGLDVNLRHTFRSSTPGSPATTRAMGSIRLAWATSTTTTGIG